MLSIIRAAYAAVLPQPDATVFARALHVYDALIGRTSETQLNIFKRLNKLPVNQYIYIRQHLVGYFNTSSAALSQIYVVSISAIAPYVLVRKFALDAAQ